MSDPFLYEAHYWEPDEPMPIPAYLIENPESEDTPMSFPKTYAETYTMRSRFFVLLGEAGKLLAEAYTQADAENRAAIKELAFDAMAHSLEEHQHQPLD